MGRKAEKDDWLVKAGRSLPDDAPESGTAAIASEGSESGTVATAPKLATELPEPASLNIDVQGAELVTVEALTFERLMNAPVSSATLDAVGHAIKALDRGGAKCAWATAKLLARVKDRLWETRMDRYKGFDDWAKREAGMSVQHANRLIKLSEKFSEKDFETVGVTKLLVLLKVTNEAALDDLKAMLAANPSTSVRQLARHAEALQPKPEPKPEPSTTDGDGHDEPTSAPSDDDEGDDAEEEPDAKPVPGVVENEPKAKRLRLALERSGRREDNAAKAFALVEVEGKRIEVEIDFSKSPDKWRVFESVDGGEA